MYEYTLILVIWNEYKKDEIHEYGMHCVCTKKIYYLPKRNNFSASKPINTLGFSNICFGCGYECVFQTSRNVCVIFHLQRKV